MDIKDKRILIFGLGLTGISALGALKAYWGDISVYNDSSKEDIESKLIENNITGIQILSDFNNIENIDLIIKSPGIMPSHPLIKRAEELGIPIISDIELAYCLRGDNLFYGITGTNGKTTSTVLAGNIFRRWNPKTHIGGNVGVGVLGEISNISEDDIFLLELSSFQLEQTVTFKPKVALILNITPDHIDWHGSMKSYMNSKFKIFRNQNRNDYLVLNYDDVNLRALKGKTNSNEIFFSQKEILDRGIYLKGNSIYYNDKEEKKILDINEIKIPGKHNIENIMGVVGLSIAAGVPVELIRDEIVKFKGVEHRIEYVKTIKGVKYYNDSKGTNMESTIKAIEALDGPLILIAGGYDKGSTFDELIMEFKNKGKTLIVFGATKDRFVDAAKRNGFENLFLVHDLKEAVELSHRMAIEDDTVLLSPACASWDMYKNFEERGNHFKELVARLTE